MISCLMILYGELLLDLLRSFLKQRLAAIASELLSKYSFNSLMTHRNLASYSESVNNFARIIAVSPDGIADGELGCKLCPKLNIPPIGPVGLEI